MKIGTENVYGVLFGDIEVSAIYVGTELAYTAFSQGLEYTDMGEYYTVSGRGTFTGEKLIIPSRYKGLSVTGIDYGAFSASSNTDLLSIRIPDSVTVIGKHAFSGCGGVKSVIIGEGVTSIGDSAFSSLRLLSELKFNAIECADFNSYGNSVFHEAGENGDGIDITIGSKVKRIPAYLSNPTSGAAAGDRVKYIAKIRSR